MIRAFIIFVALVFGAFGVAYFVAPAPLAVSAGIETVGSGLTDVRATYGGFQFALGLFLLWASLSAERYRSAVMLIGLVAAFVAFGRILGIVLDGNPKTFHIIGLIFEIPLTAISVWLYRTLK